MDRISVSRLMLLPIIAVLAVACSRAPVADAPIADAPVANAPIANAPATPSGTPAPGPRPAPAGEPLVFKACAPQRPQACTREYNPVCATRDTGIRCITTPCPSSEQKTFGNACDACADPKVSGWTKGVCPTG